MRRADTNPLSLIIAGAVTRSALLKVFMLGERDSRDNLELSQRTCKNSPQARVNRVAPWKAAWWRVSLKAVTLDCNHC